jgi:uncharacterized protein YecT (DUF1311 family)
MRFSATIAIVSALSVPPAIADQRADDFATLEICLAAAVPWKEADACIGVIDAPCQAAGHSSTQEMFECMARERRAWDSVMDAALTLLHTEARETESLMPDAATGPALDDALTASQDAWRAFIRAHCHYWRQRNSGGSIARLNATACFMRMTAERAIELDRFLRHSE